MGFSPLWNLPFYKSQQKSI